MTAKGTHERIQAPERIHRSFVVMEHKDGNETLALEGSNAVDRELGDLAALQC